MRQRDERQRGRGQEIAVKVAIDAPGKEDEMDETANTSVVKENGMPSTAEGSASVDPPAAA